MAETRSRVSTRCVQMRHFSTPWFQRRTLERAEFADHDTPPASLRITSTEQSTTRSSAAYVVHGDGGEPACIPLDR